MEEAGRPTWKRRGQIERLEEASSSSRKANRSLLMLGSNDVLRGRFVTESIRPETFRPGRFVPFSGRDVSYHLGGTVRMGSFRPIFSSVPYELKIKRKR